MPTQTYNLATLNAHPSATGGSITVGVWKATDNPTASPQPAPLFTVEVAVDPSTYDPANPQAFVTAQVAAVHAAVEAELVHQDTEALLLRLGAQFNGVVLQHPHTSS